MVHFDNAEHSHPRTQAMAVAVAGQCLRHTLSRAGADRRERTANAERLMPECRRRVHDDDMRRE